MADQVPMRIMIFSTNFFPTTGGVQTYVALLADGFVRAGHETTVVTGTAAPDHGDPDAGYLLVRKPSLLQLWRLIDDADVVQLAGPSFVPLLLCLLLHKPVFIEHHNYQAVCPNGLLLYGLGKSACPGHFMVGRHSECWRCVAIDEGWATSFKKWVLTFPRRWLCKHATGNSPITQHVLNRLELPRSQVIYYGIPDQPLQDTSGVSLDKDPLWFAYVGRLVAEKGLPLLVDAASRLREEGYDFRLKFIGDGSERSTLQRMVEEKGLSSQVVFTGFLGGEELQRATRDVSAVVMPSIMEETAGLAAIEQMMRGRLVIASDIGGLGEVVDGAGLKFTAGNVSQLTACMRQVINRPQLVGEMGERARRRSRELFTQNRMVQNYLSLYVRPKEERTDARDSCTRWIA